MQLQSWIEPRSIQKPNFETIQPQLEYNPIQLTIDEKSANIYRYMMIIEYQLDLLITSKL